ncbi:MAG: Na+/H+ antiporter NhaC family protein [Faecalibacterium sp.]|nr:Na+/H+ antiporter NhaC family protein [Faecalibacterium sp.]
MDQKRKIQSNPIALLPIGVFLVLYLGMGLVFEYALKIEMGFYKIPIVVVFLVSLLVAFVQNRALKFDDKLEVVARSVGDKDIITMILIFLAAGVFVGVTGRDSAEAVAYFLLSVTPAWAAVAVLFIAACFVSVAMGTSVGTITLIVPIAVAVANVSGFSLPLCIGSVMGGAMFGDNLSFISDTTIAACNSQGCEMQDKFRANFKIALPAALVTLALILVLSYGTGVSQIEPPAYNLLLLIPYVLVLVGGIVGINVFVVLLVGIFSGIGISLLTGTMDPITMLGNMGSGASGMFETIMVTVLVSAMCGLIREFGGFEALLAGIRRVFKGRIGGRLGVGLLVGAMDVATANNTVAIVMAGPIAKEISEEYGITPKESASLLDTFSCIFQGVIPYGAQMLIAVSTAMNLGSTVSAFEILPCLFYPYVLAVCSVIYIVFSAGKKKAD